MHLALFFVTAMVCHGELARRRPPASGLTEFYLCVSLGGVLGGVFAALVAPALFPDIWEYPLLLVAACLVRPPSAERKGGLRGDLVCFLVLAACLFTLVYTGTVAGRLAAPVLAVAGLMLLRLSERRWWFAVGVGAFLLVEYTVAAGAVTESARSFFGVHRVKLMEQGSVRVLEHGTSIHGAAYIAAGRETTPLTYYSREGPFGRFFTAIANRRPQTIGVVGLGIGELVCYAQPGQRWTFHEIDPLVEKIARDTRYFHSLERCGDGAANVVLGDARLTLQDVPDAHYDVLVIDAFSSDSIPLHLLTREALALYQRKLAPNGVILFHISYRYVDLRPVLAALVADTNSPARRLLDLAPQSTSVARLASEVVAIGRPGHGLDDLPTADGWRDMAATPRGPLWTDTRSDIVGSIRIFGRDMSPD
jgi:spermidine synthase